MSPILTGVIASGISGHLTPPWSPEGAYDALATATVPSGGLSSITFTGIPQTGYSHLQVRISAQSNRGTYGIDNPELTFNSDTGNNYSWHSLTGDGAGTGYNAVSTTSFIAVGDRTIGTGVSGTFGGIVIDLLDYAETTKYKTTRALGGADTNGVIAGFAGAISFSSGLWQSTSAITSITLAPQHGSLFNQYSSFALYGVK